MLVDSDIVMAQAAEAIARCRAAASNATTAGLAPGRHRPLRSPHELMNIRCFPWFALTVAKRNMAVKPAVCPVPRLGTTLWV